MLINRKEKNYRLEYVPINQITNIENTLIPEQDKETYESLKSSIREVGQLEAVVLQVSESYRKLQDLPDGKKKVVYLGNKDDWKFTLIAGRHRVRALIELGAKDVWAVVFFRDVMKSEALSLQVIIETERRHLSPDRNRALHYQAFRQLVKDNPHLNNSKVRKAFESMCANIPEQVRNKLDVVYHDTQGHPIYKDLWKKVIYGESSINEAFKLARTINQKPMKSVKKEEFTIEGEEGDMKEDLPLQDESVNPSRIKKSATSIIKTYLRNVSAANAFLQDAFLEHEEKMVSLDKEALQELNQEGVDFVRKIEEYIVRLKVKE